jgi:hypothetical protein
MHFTIHFNIFYYFKFIRFSSHSKIITRSVPDIQRVAALNSFVDGFVVDRSVWLSNLKSDQKPSVLMSLYKSGVVRTSNACKSASMVTTSPWA